MFASAFTNERLGEIDKQLKPGTVQIIEKPFHIDTLFEELEDRDIYEALQCMSMNVEFISSHKPSRRFLLELLEAMCRITGR